MPIVTLPGYDLARAALVALDVSKASPSELDAALDAAAVAAGKGGGNYATAVAALVDHAVKRTDEGKIIALTELKAKELAARAAIKPAESAAYDRGFRKGYEEGVAVGGPTVELSTERNPPALVTVTTLVFDGTPETVAIFADGAIAVWSPRHRDWKPAPGAARLDYAELFPTRRPSVDGFEPAPVADLPEISAHGKWTTLRWDGEPVWRCNCPDNDSLRAYRNNRCVNCGTSRPLPLPTERPT